MRSIRRGAAAALGTSLVVAATGCAGPPGKSGGAPAVVLRLAVVDLPGEPASRLADRLAGRVDALSGGALRVSIVRPAPARAGGQAASEAIRLVRSDAAQLAIVPSWAFRAQGVTSLQALQTPFLVRSPALAARVTTGPIAERFEAGLRGISLVGVGLVPEGLERPFGFEKALVTPADFDRVSVRADGSALTTSLLRAFGARPVALTDPSVDTALRTGFGGSDPSPASEEVFPKHAFTAGNLVLFPRIDVVVAGADALDRLRHSQLTILRRAVADARAGTIDAADDRAEAVAYCRGGGTVVTAPPAALRLLQAAAAPVVAGLRRDATTDALVARIRRLRGSVQDAVPACRPRPAEAYGGPRVITRPPDGSYRRVFTAPGLRDAGATSAEADDNQGVTTLTFAHGRFTLDWRGPVRRKPCGGRVALTDGLVELRWDPGTGCSGYVAFAWKLAGRDLAVVALDPRRGATWPTRAYRGIWQRVD